MTYDPDVHLNPGFFGHVADGVVDLWIDDEFTKRQVRFIYNALDDYGLEIIEHDRRKDADFRVIYSELIDEAAPGVVGRSTSYWFRDLTKIQLSTRNEKKFDRFLINHEVGHSLGLAHRFNDKVSDTVMNYPSLSQIRDGRAARRLTPFDRQNIRNFLEYVQSTEQKNTIIDDEITGEHYCGAHCNHTFD